MVRTGLHGVQAYAPVANNVKRRLIQFATPSDENARALPLKPHSVAG